MALSRSSYQIIIFILVVITLSPVAGCGGSGGGGGNPPPSFTVTTTVDAADPSDPHGSVSPASQTVSQNQTASITITPDLNYSIDSATGCNGTLSGSTFTTGAITADCEITVSFSLLPPVTPAQFDISYQATKQFHFTWMPAEFTDYYRLLENPDGISGFTQVGNDIEQPLVIGNGAALTYDLTVPLIKRLNAQYILQSCNNAGCSDANVLNVSGNLAEAIGYFKASNTGEDDRFGMALDISDDGLTIAVGAPNEDSDDILANSGGGGDDDDSPQSGAVYIFVLVDSQWQQQSYVKPSNTGDNDKFGSAVSLSADGNVLAIGAPFEDGPADNVTAQGSVYVFERTLNGSWLQRAYLNANNPSAQDLFGTAVALDNSGSLLVIGAPQEQSATTGVNPEGSTTDNTLSSAGAVYVFRKNNSSWMQEAFLKASNTDALDFFGRSIAVSGDGATIAVGAPGEDSQATGVNGDQSNDSALGSGAVYLFTFNLSAGSAVPWNQGPYFKASNTGAGDQFGNAVSLNDIGTLLAVGAFQEGSSAINVDGDQSNNLSANAGAVYVFTGTPISPFLKQWSQTAYLKASNTGSGDEFGYSVKLSGSGDTLLVGAQVEDGNGIGIEPADNDDASGTGAAYVFSRSAGQWQLPRYIKPIVSEVGSEAGEQFGVAVGVDSDGDTLVVGAFGEDSGSVGVNGDSNNNSEVQSGAVYVY